MSATNFYAADVVDYMDTYLVFNRKGTNQFFFSLSNADYSMFVGGTAFDPLDIAAKTGGNDNDINPIKGALNLIVWPYLTSTTAWFVLDMEAHELNFFVRKDEGVKGPVYDFDNEAAKWKVAS